MQERLLILSHGHPDFSAGGAETAAYTHWKEFRRRGIETMLICRVENSPGHVGASFSARSEDGLEMLFSPPAVDHFRHSQPQPHIVYEHFRALLERFKPTAVHFHHYAHMGLEMIREVRKYSSDIPIILTLHEFLGICHAQGQMLKTNGSLCQKAAPLDCHLCFPDISPQNFFMRELFIKSFLNLVDYFVCPSEFLRSRYLAWGLPASKMIVLENGQQPQELGNVEDPDNKAVVNRFVVLGQLSRRKGTLVLLDAVRLLPKPMRKFIKVELHGSAQYAEDGFTVQFEKALSDLKETVTYCGPYVQRNVYSILRRNHWLVVPSIWWENSPMVIQEAFAARRPIICSDVGGMAEKVKHGEHGIHFHVHNAADLAARMQECSSNPDLWNQLCANLPQPPSIAQTAEVLLNLYRKETAHSSLTNRKKFKRHKSDTSVSEIEVQLPQIPR